MKLDPTPPFPRYDAKAGHLRSSGSIDVIAVHRDDYALLDKLLPGANPNEDIQ